MSAGDDYDKMIKGDPGVEDIYKWTKVGTGGAAAAAAAAISGTTTLSKPPVSHCLV